MINIYATDDLKNDSILVEKKRFWINHKEDWTIFKKCLYKLIKKGHIEEKFENNKTYIRLVNNMFYDWTIYKSKQEA